MTQSAVARERAGSAMATQPSPGEVKLIQGIRDVVKEVTDPRFNGIDQRFDGVQTQLNGLQTQFNNLQTQMNKKFEEILSKLSAPKP